MKTPITAADPLNDRVLPLLEEQQLPLLRILTEQQKNEKACKNRPFKTVSDNTGMSHGGDAGT